MNNEKKINSSSLTKIARLARLEINKDSVVYAKKNAQINNIKNVIFKQGDVDILISEYFLSCAHYICLEKDFHQLFNIHCSLYSFYLYFVKLPA